MVGMDRAMNSDFYDRIFEKAKSYRCRPENSAYYPLWMLVLKRMMLGWKVLDIGCGPGQFARLCVDAGHPYVGLDFSRVAVELGGDKVPEVEFYLVDLRKDRSMLKKGEYDVATFIEFLEHVTDDLGILGTVPKGKQIILTVPDFGKKQHVRSFKTKEDVLERYGPLLEIIGKVGLYKYRWYTWYVVSGVRR